MQDTVVISSVFFQFPNLKDINAQGAFSEFVAASFHRLQLKNRYVNFYKIAIILCQSKTPADETKAFLISAFSPWPVGTGPSSLAENKGKGMPGSS
jgi:hypothetical protein